MSNLIPYPFYLLRTPSMPVQKLLNLHEQGNFEENLKKVFGEAEMKEAIYTASPELFNVMVEWLDGKLKEDKQKNKLLQSLHKYYTRMSSRCTPYGLFAGCTIGDIIENRTNIEFDEKVIKKHSRLDMNYVAELTNYFNSIPELVVQLKYFPNNTLYKVGKKYRFIEFSLKNKKRSYRLTSLSESAYLELVLFTAIKGENIKTICEVLIENGVEESLANTYISKLIESQILVSDLHPTVTGDEYFDVLISQLKKLSGTEQYVIQLGKVKEILIRQDNNIEKYIDLKKIVQSFIPTESKDLVQTDLFYELSSNVLNEEVVNEIISNSENLHKIGSIGKNINLEEFKKKFITRYEDNEVPLFFVLDSEIGIGYGLNTSGNTENMPLLGNLSIPTKGQEHSFPWNNEGKKIFQKLKHFINSKAEVVEITDEDLKDISDKNSGKNIPPSSYLLGSLLSSSTSELDRGNFKFFLSVLGGPSAGNLLARFCHGSSKLSQLVTNCLDEEMISYGDTILAEVVHLPDSRVGNVLMRPNFRQYEIPFLGKSSVSEEFQIPVSDLMVSVKNDRIVIRSKRLNKEVIPRLTNAHNFSRGLSVYRFLCDLQYQGVAGAYFWNWSIFNEEVYLPRIEYKKLILQRARWFFKKKDYPQLQSKKEDFTIFFQELQHLYNIPRLVVIREGDNELLIDFCSNESISLFVEILKKKDVELFEYLFKNNQCFIRDKDGGYANEIIIPLKSKMAEPQIHLFSEKRVESNSLIQRNFIIGSEWLYIKIYAGNKVLDSILTDVIKPLTEELLLENNIDKWFFIRYNDPDGHLRIRFHHYTKPSFWSDVIGKLYIRIQPFLDNNLITKILTDTYNREIERYGVATMDISEDLFYADSVCIMNFLDLIEGDEGERYRWLFSLRNIDCLLNDFNYSIEQKFELLSHIQASFYYEFNRDNKTDKLLYSLNDKYREESKNIAQILNSDKDTEDISIAVECFNNRSKDNSHIIKQLKDAFLLSSDNIKTFDDLMPSYIHMSLNRTFLARPRMHELVVYHYLMKYYESQLARKRSEEKKINILITI